MSYVGLDGNQTKVAEWQSNWGTCCAHS